MFILKDIITKCGVFILLLPCANALSDNSKPADPGISLGVQISTLGLGAQLGKQVSPNFGARLGFNTLNYSGGSSSNFSSGGLSYSGSLKLSSVTLLGDLYPTKNTSFHLTGGLVENSNSVSASATPAADPTDANPITINGNTYFANDIGTETSKVSFSKSDPYIGIGWGKPYGSGGAIRLSLDLGAMFESSSVSSSHTAATDSNNKNLNNDVNSSIQSTLKYLKVYPVVSLGIAFHV
jgi:hypothetical protein